MFQLLLITLLLLSVIPGGSSRYIGHGQEIGNITGYTPGKRSETFNHTCIDTNNDRYLCDGYEVGCYTYCDLFNDCDDLMDEIDCRSWRPHIGATYLKTLALEGRLPPGLAERFQTDIAEHQPARLQTEIAEHSLPDPKKTTASSQTVDEDFKKTTWFVTLIIGMVVLLLTLIAVMVGWVYKVARTDSRKRIWTRLNLNDEMKTWHKW